MTSFDVIRGEMAAVLAQPRQSCLRSDQSALGGALGGALWVRDGQARE
jgi:hypothetical protein